MITYRASLDVPLATLGLVTGWLRAHRRRVDVRPWQRAASARTQAIMVLRWFREATDLKVLAADAGVSIATAYRYLHEAIDVVAVHAPTLEDVLARAAVEKWTFVCLDGTLIATDRCTAKSESGGDLWYSGKHRQHGANVQVITDPAGYPAWVGPAEPGSFHDITCAREHAFGALYRAAAGPVGIPTLTDKGYHGAGCGIVTPFKGRDLDPDNATFNMLLSALRAPAERANALLKQTWRALGHVRLAPTRITEIVSAALVLLHHQQGIR